MTDYVKELRAGNKQSALADYVEKLEARLEISSDHSVDGIEARDATIKLQDKTIEQLIEDRDKLDDLLVDAQATIEKLVAELDDARLLLHRMTRSRDELQSLNPDGIQLIPLKTPPEDENITTNRYGCKTCTICGLAGDLEGHTCTTTTTGG